MARAGPAVALRAKQARMASHGGPAQMTRRRELLYFDIVLVSRPSF